MIQWIKQLKPEMIKISEWFVKRDMFNINDLPYLIVEAAILVYIWESSIETIKMHFININTTY